ncbi:MAG: TldD/PmbA family protein [Eubacteriales bacterium]|nr:TldD/PmbA family protein [Eubacteriales bacterium]
MEKNTFIELLFARAKQAGFTDCEVYISAGDEFEVNIFKGEILQYTSAASEGLGFRGLYNGKMGVSSTEVYDEESIDQLIENALEAAKLIENEDEQFIYAGDGQYPEVRLYSEELETVSAAEKIALAKEIEKAVYAQDAKVVQTEAAEVVSMSSSCRIVNTKGLDVSYRSNVAAAYAVPVVADEGKASSGMSIKSDQDFAALAAKKDEIAAEAVKEAIDFLHAESVPSGEYAVLLRNDAAGSVLRTFCGVFNAENAQKGLSLLNGREGETIAAPCVTIVDDPLRDGSTASSPFDDEGVATYTKNIVENGVLKTLLHNLKTANKQGVKSTGNASRAGYSAPVGVSPSNFYIRPGARSLEEMAAEMGEGLLITDLQGLHAGANGISGDFSLGAKGYRIVGGKVGAPVEQITVAGNFFKVLENIAEVGSDLRFGMPGGSVMGSPTLWIKGLAVAGK